MTSHGSCTERKLKLVTNAPLKNSCVFPGLHWLASCKAGLLGFPKFDLNNLAHVLTVGKDTGVQVLDSLVKQTICLHLSREQNATSEDRYM